MIFVYDRRRDRLVAKGSAPRSHGRGPYVIRDEMTAMQSMADGKYYTSKRKYEADVRARGLDIVGNEKQKATPIDLTHDVHVDVQRAYAEVASR
jgi:hypothetical protein